ncbi:MAG TPA: hypothetical protein VFE48_17120 [Methylomirabilota bacterium]|nr:hypothetical protein [Methylomirabilota bacterium]
MFEGHTSNSTDDAFMQGFRSAWTGPSFWKPVASADKQYQAYLMARDWWEFDHAQRVPAGYDAPDAYGALLYSRWHKLPMAQPVTSYRTFVGWSARTPRERRGRRCTMRRRTRRDCSW